jgi:Ca-activated chloride channel family protein
MKPALLRATLWTTVTLIASAAAFTQDEPPRRGFAIDIVSPKNDEVVFGKTPIRAEVKIDDPSAVDRVEFLIGEKLVFVDRDPPYEHQYDFGEEPRSFIVRAIAHHREGVTVSDTIVTRRVALTFVEEVRRIVLWAVFTDKDDNFVTDLTKDDLRVVEEGRAQTIQDFYTEDRPIAMAILLDASGSMREQMREVHAAAGRFVDTLREQDRAMVIAFDDKVWLIQDLTGDRKALKQSITSTEAIGATALHDAMHAAYRKLRSVQGVRKAIVLLSDGDDTSSNVTYKRILEEAKSENVIVYAIGLGGGMFASERKANLKELSGDTGGRAFFVDKASELADAYENIAEELRKQYFITYSTPNTVWDGRFIQVKVEPTEKKLNVRARKGYFAVKPKSSS